MRIAPGRENTARRAWFPHPPAAAHPDRRRDRRADVLRGAARRRGRRPGRAEPGAGRHLRARCSTRSTPTRRTRSPRATELVARLRRRYAGDESLRRVRRRGARRDRAPHGPFSSLPPRRLTSELVELGRATEAGRARRSRASRSSARGHPHHRLHGLSHEHLPAQVHRHRADGGRHARARPWPTTTATSRQQPWWPALRATTSWLRLWADWPSLQRVAGAPPGSGDGAASLDALDAQIDAALADGMEIILMPYRYPRWANGTGAPSSGRPGNWELQPWDRHARLSRSTSTSSRAAARARRGRRCEYRMPLDGFGPDSRVGEYVAVALGALRRTESAAFEVVNEPNVQIWPQRTPVETDDFDGPLGHRRGRRSSITPAVADMMITVDAIARARSRRTAAARAVDARTATSPTVPRYTTISHANAYAPSADPFVESLLDGARAARLHGRRPLDLGLPQLHRRRAQAAARRRPAPAC